jgi:hypothetical protein
VFVSYLLVKVNHSLHVNLSSDILMVHLHPNPFPILCHEHTHTLISVVSLYTGEHIYVDPSTTLYKRLGFNAKAKFYGCRILCGQTLRALALCCCKCWCPCTTGMTTHAHPCCVVLDSLITTISNRWCDPKWWIISRVIHR